MNFVVNITTSGRFTIPQKLRELFGWKHGDMLMFNISESGEIIIKKK